jgi:hypothetical protein
MSEASLIPIRRIERMILLLRGEKVMLDFDLGELYGVEARALNQAVKRNLDRFPDDFMFRLSPGEARLVMREQIVSTSETNSSQSVMSSRKHRGASYRPYAFSEQGVAMLSSVLRSPRAVQVNIAIMRTFVQLRQMLSSNADLSRKLAALEGKYDKQFREVFDAIHELMRENKKSKREIGFHTLMPKPAKAGSANARKI